MKDRIKKLRCENGLNQSELASIMGIKQSSLSLIERGINSPTVSQIELLSRYFGVSADYLLFGSDDIKPAERDILKAVRDDRSIYDAIQRVIASKKHFEGMAA
jgi:transcriptional regulator with XRE-family HTH domain